MGRCRWALLFALVCPLAGAAFPPVPKPKENKAAAKELAKALQGTWEVAEIERGGRLAKGATKLPYTMTVTIEGTKLGRKLDIKGKELTATSSTITLDTTKSPAWFDVKSELGNTGRVSVMKGIVKVDGDKMIWSYASGTGDRPTKFDAELGNLQYRYTLKRVKR